MTEQQWLTYDDPVRMPSFLLPPCGDRKLLLYAVACCRLNGHLLPRQGSRVGLEWAERFADDHTARDNEPERVDWDCEGAAFYYEYGDEPADPTERAGLTSAAYFVDSIRSLDSPDSHDFFITRGGPLLSADPLRDIFGNPFRPVAFDPAWRTSAAVALARQMYDGRDFAAMPILADALQDAGCDNPDVLAHCRGDGPHVRGCWVVDLVLGKS